MHASHPLAVKEIAVGAVGGEEAVVALVDRLVVAREQQRDRALDALVGHARLPPGGAHRRHGVGIGLGAPAVGVGLRRGRPQRRHGAGQIAELVVDVDLHAGLGRRLGRGAAAATGARAHDQCDGQRRHNLGSFCSLSLEAHDPRL